MTVRLSLWQRALLALAVAAALCVPGYSYLATHQIERTVRQFIAGKQVTWPPAPKRKVQGQETLADRTVGRLTGPLKGAGLALAASALLLAGSRSVARRRRARELATFELRLSRDDVANPFRVQETFEGILGAISARWYRRLWRGQDHFSLELHRGPTGLIAFTLATRRPLVDTIAGALEALYPDVRLIPLQGRPSCQAAVTRLKKRRSHVLSLLTLRNYEHGFSESLVALLAGLKANISVQLVITPAPAFIHGRARRLFKRRERQLNYGDRQDPLDPGMESVVEGKELKQALETQHRSLCYFDLRVAGDDPTAVRRVAGLFSQLRAENELAARDMRIRRRIYQTRIRSAQPNPLPGWRTGIVSSSELSTLWQLPAARAKHAPILRSTTRRALASPEICRDAACGLMRDEHGPVGLAPADRKYGHALIGGQGGGKTSCLARHLAVAAGDPDRAIIVIDGKGPLAEAALGMIPAERIVHYLDFAQPQFGVNPLQIDATPGATAAVFVQALVEANPPGAIQAASDSFLRQAISAVCAVEPSPTLWHVYRMLDFRGQADYRDHVVQRLERVPGTDFARNYWRREFPALIGDKGFAAGALNPPRNKIERLISTRETDLLLRHPNHFDLGQIIGDGQVLVVNAAKASIGEDNARLIMQLLLALLHRQLQTRQREHPDGRVTLLFDEAHNVLTPAVATMLAEGRSAGLEAVFAWQYSAQIADEVVRSGVRSLLQSISIFRMREMADARSLAGLAMDVYSDHISADQEDQARLRFSADDITRLDTHHAINLWVANNTPRPGFIATTLPWEELYNPQLADHHRKAQTARGGYCPNHLPDPLTVANAEPHSASNGSSEKPPHPNPARRPHRPRSTPASGKQLVWDDLEELD